MMRIVGLLIVFGMVALLNMSVRRDKVVSALLSLLFGFLFYDFWNLSTGMSDRVYLIPWNGTVGGTLELEILSSATHLILLPFFVMTALVLLNNLFFRYERRKTDYTGVLLLDLACFILLVSGQHYIQMITCVFLIDILTQFLIKNMTAGRYYALWNFVADMCLFGVLALLHGQVDTLNVAQIQSYHHRDLVAILLLFALAVKFGFLPFQSLTLNLNAVRFHRLILIPSFASPAVALVLSAKLYPLLEMSHLFRPILNFGLALVVLIALPELIRRPSLKEKYVFFNTILTAFLVKFLEMSGFLWNESLSEMLVLGLILNMTVYDLHYYLERNSACLAGRLAHLSSFKRLILLVLWMMVLALLVRNGSTLPDGLERLVVLVGLALFCFATGCLFGRHEKDHSFESETDVDGRPLPTLLAMYALTVYALSKTDGTQAVFVLCGIVLFGLGVRIASTSSCCEVSANEETFSVLLKRKIKNLMSAIGRIFDFFEEKMNCFEQSLLTSESFSISLFRRVARIGQMRYAFCILIGLLTLLWCFVKG